MIKIEPTKIFKSIDAVLAYYLVATTLFSAFVFFFVFIVNWEDGFWGIKLDGLPAGSYLFSKGAVAILLALLVLKYREKIEILTACTSFYFTYLIGPGLFTPQLTPNGTVWQLSLFCIVILVPTLLLGLHWFVRWKYKQLAGISGDEAT